jgi:hypothetical protein
MLIGWREPREKYNLLSPHLLGRVLHRVARAGQHCFDFGGSVLFATSFRPLAPSIGGARVPSKDQTFPEEWQKLREDPTILTPNPVRP